MTAQTSDANKQLSASVRAKLDAALAMRQAASQAKKLQTDQLRERLNAALRLRLSGAPIHTVETSLRHAVLYGDAASIPSLLASGALGHSLGASSPLVQLAFERDHSQCLAALIEHGAVEPERPVLWQMESTMACFEHDAAGCLRVLLSRQGHPKLFDPEGLLALCQERGPRPKCEAVLEAAILEGIIDDDAGPGSALRI